MNYSEFKAQYVKDHSSHFNLHRFNVLLIAVSVVVAALLGNPWSWLAMASIIIWVGSLVLCHIDTKVEDIPFTVMAFFHTLLDKSEEVHTPVTNDDIFEEVHTPVEETKPAEEVKPVEDVKPVEEPSPVVAPTQSKRRQRSRKKS